MSERTPLGILGGTFDPVHYAHLRLAEEARGALGLEAVLWIPAGRPPHRSQPRASAAHRLEMTRRAIAGNPAFVLDASEALAEAPSYTVSTLGRLRALHGAARPLVLLMGADAFLGLAAWHRWRELFDLAHIAVASRPGFALQASTMEAALAAEFEARSRQGGAEAMAQPAGAVLGFEITALAISASQIRALLGAAASARYLLPDPVLDYIGRNRLYSSDPHGH